MDHPVHKSYLLEKFKKIFSFFSRMSQKHLILPIKPKYVYKPKKGQIVKKMTGGVIVRVFISTKRDSEKDLK